MSTQNKQITIMVADDEEIVNDPSIYPTEEVAKKLYTFTVYPTKLDRVGARVWTAVKTGQ